MSIIRLINISKSYFLGEEEIPVLKNINLRIAKGEFVAIMGPSGSGKSTLMNILGFLDFPTKGKYYFENQDVTTLNDKDTSFIRNKKIGFVFQAFNLLKLLNVLENVELPLVYARIKKSVARQQAFQVIKAVKMEERLYHRPFELSGGQQQRVAIARAIVNNPEIILADEPTGNLDTITSQKIMGIFQKLNQKGKTIVIVTHDVEIAQCAKRIIELRDGVMIRDKLVDNPVLYETDFEV